MKLLAEIANTEAQKVFKELPVDLVKAIERFASSNFRLIQERQVPLLYRGGGVDKGEWKVSEVRRGNDNSRVSKTGDNTILDFVASSPLWAEYPNRKRSIFANTRPGKATAFGRHVYVIVPFDTVNAFGLAPGDFNYQNGSWKNQEPSFIDSLVDVLPLLNRACIFIRYSFFDDQKTASSLAKDVIRVELYDFIKSLGEHTFLDARNNPLKQARIIDKIFEFGKKQSTFHREYMFDALGRAFSQLEFVNGGKLEDYLTKRATPESCGMRLIRGYAGLKEADEEFDGGHDNYGLEVWFEGQYISISKKLLNL